MHHESRTGWEEKMTKNQSSNVKGRLHRKCTRMDAMYILIENDIIHGNWGFDYSNISINFEHCNLISDEWDSLQEKCKFPHPNK